MGQQRFTVQPRPYDQLALVAFYFLQKHHAHAGPPVDIERIVDVKMNIQIIPWPRLQSDCDVDACLSSDCTAIYVDDRVFLSPNQNRVRFSLAHELAHVLLHKPIFAAMAFNTVVEWKQAYHSIPHHELSLIESQAYALGGLLLVPRDPFRAKYAELTDDSARKLSDAEMIAVEAKLAQHFQVSTEVIQRRSAREGFQNSLA